MEIRKEVLVRDREFRPRAIAAGLWLAAAMTGAASCGPAGPAAQRSDDAAVRVPVGAVVTAPGAPLGARYALVSPRRFGRYAKGGPTSGVGVSTETLAETLSFADPSAAAGAFAIRRLQRLIESERGRSRGEHGRVIGVRIDSSENAGTFRWVADTLQLVMRGPTPRLTFIHSFRVGAGGDTLETVAARCVPTFCGGTAALNVYVYARAAARLEERRQ